MKTMHIFKSFFLTLFLFCISGLQSTELASGGAGTVAAKYDHSLYLNPNGMVWAWGFNAFGQLGNGNNTNSNVPLHVGGSTPLTNISAIASGNYHSIALANDGTVWIWGNNAYGQLGNNSRNDSWLPTRPEGTLTNVIAVAGGQFHSIVLKNDGTVWAWGSNANGQLGNGTSVDSLIPVKVSNLTGIKAIASGDSHNLALASNGTVWAWGYNGSGQLGNGSFTSASIPVQVVGIFNVSAVAAGGQRSLVLKQDGTVWDWGYNGSGQLGNDSTIVSALPVQVGGSFPIKNGVAIAAGENHSLVIRSDGTTWSWGANNMGQLGNNSTIPDAKTPVVVGNYPVMNLVSIAGGNNHSLSVDNAGRVLVWGANNYGQLGNNVYGYIVAPIQISIPD